MAERGVLAFAGGHDAVPLSMCANANATPDTSTRLYALRQKQDAMLVVG